MSADSTDEYNVAELREFMKRKKSAEKVGGKIEGRKTGRRDEPEAGGRSKRQGFDYVNYYEVLGVPRTASQDEIKLAFKRKARQFHPDRNPNSIDATARFQEAAAAYEVLGDVVKRATYDGQDSGSGLMTQAQVDAATASATAGGKCPVCQGSGSVRTPDLSSGGRILFWSNKPCPRGCKGKKK